MKQMLFPTRKIGRISLKKSVNTLQNIYLLHINQWLLSQSYKFGTYELNFRPLYSWEILILYIVDGTQQKSSFFSY